MIRTQQEKQNEQEKKNEFNLKMIFFLDQLWECLSSTSVADWDHATESKAAALTRLWLHKALATACIFKKNTQTQQELQFQVKGVNSIGWKIDMNPLSCPNITTPPIPSTHTAICKPRMHKDRTFQQCKPIFRSVSGIFWCVLHVISDSSRSLTKYYFVLLFIVNISSSYI